MGLWELWELWELWFFCGSFVKKRISKSLRAKKMPTPAIFVDEQNNTQI